MTQLYERSVKTLELPAVLEMLSAEAISEPARERVRGLRPSGDRWEVKKRLAQTTAAKDMMVLKGSPSFGGVKDVRSSLSRAERGGLLNTRELLDIAAVLRCARSVKAYGEGQSSDRGDLSYLFSSLTTNKYLEEKISTSITGEDEIADCASDELARIRRLTRAASARIRDGLQKIISSPSYAKILQEPIITTRSGRYVVPVKAEHRGGIQGLVHDISSSGATIFVEPMSVVKENNEIRELAAREKQEIERILAELSGECAQFGVDIERDFTLLVELDCIFARAKLSYRLNCMEPEIKDRRIVLKKARHPLLDQSTAVPIDPELGDGFDTLVITGPNTGGKTVSLKTIGLLCVMAACGLHIPAADGSCVPVFSSVLADIGDEQSIEQSLSTFSSHMTNITAILEKCDENSLLLFDELGAGTDPVEGAALATAIIEYARGKGVMTVATTHYAELKAYATSQQGVQNASCEFDVQSLRPTYRLLIGMPGKSNAFAISERLGLPPEIIADAKRRVDPDNAGFEATIEKLETQRLLLEKDREEAARLLRSAEENAKKSDMLRRELTVRLEKADEKARREASRILEDARRTAEQTFDELDEMRKRRSREQDYARENEARAAMRRTLNQAEERLAGPREKVSVSDPGRPMGPIKVGDTVEHIQTGLKGRVLEIMGDGKVRLQAGAMNLTAETSILRIVSSENKKAAAPSAAGPVTLRAGVAQELDIRGMTAEEGVMVMERYIDSAILGKMESVRIIHGKGTGVLRAAVHASLKSFPGVKSFRLGRFGEGEAGVTIVELK